MDRREALKKLAVGGALAAGGSIVLSSNNVAFAQSASGPPSPAAVPIATPTTGKKGAGIIELAAPPAPAGADPATTTFEWQILGCNVPNGRTLVILNSANGQIIARANKGSCSPIPVSTGPRSNAPSVVVRTVAGGSSNPKELSPGDSVSLRLIVKWYVNGILVEGRYAIGGVYPNISASQA